MKEKKWSLLVIKIYIGMLLMIGIIVIVIDPFFHYHAPLEFIEYTMASENYVNDGMTRNFEYQGMITGTSTSLGFSEEEAEELFNKKFIRVSYPGEGFKKINDNINVAIENNSELNFIIRGVDPIWFITDENWLGYEEYPEYLYDDNLFNDVNYLFNREILTQNVFPQIFRTSIQEEVIQGESEEDVSSGTEKQQPEMLKRYVRPEKIEYVVDEEETKEYFRILEANLKKNVLTVIEENPNIEFYLFFPPYSICWWDSLYQSGEAVLKRRIDMEQYVIENVLKYDNVRLFSFYNNYELICNLNYYGDEVHYSHEVCSKVLNWLKDGKYELTENNYKEYIADITEFYCNYDYDSIFQ